MYKRKRGEAKQLTLTSSYFVKSSHPSTCDEFRVPATDSSSDLSAASTSAATSTRLARSSGRVDPTTLLIPPHFSRELDALNALPRADQARSHSISTTSS